MCYKVTIIILLFEIFVKEAGLNPLIVLVLASVIAVRFSQDRMEINLADFYACINTDRLDAEHFQCPVAGKAYIAKACGDVNEKAQTADGRTAFQHGHEALGLRILPGAPQIQFIGLEHDAFFGNVEQMAFIFFFISSS